FHVAMNAFDFVLSAGCNANIMWQNQPKSHVDQLKDAFEDYVDKATAGHPLSQIRELGAKVHTLITESADAINKLTNPLWTQVAPLTQELMSKFTQEAEQLKTRLEKDLTSMGHSLRPHAENMDAEALKAVVLQRSQELRAQLDKSMSQLQAQMVPYAEEIKEKMEQSLDEFQKSMVPLTQSFEIQLNQKTQEIQQNLAQRGEELRAKLEIDGQNLKRQLAALWES
uniref:Apolipoprotein A-IV n=1 Tax=Gasterosteus aculeatus aculeatus TaxID=481459 RepID=A0AAQ4RJI8_GASAC